MLRNSALDLGRREFLDLQRFPRLGELSRLPAAHQPPWADHTDLECIRAELAALPGLVGHQDIAALGAALGRVACGEAHVLHIGECAELFSMATAEHVGRRLALYRRMADHLAERTGREVVLVLRMAGQHAKPRSRPTETSPDGAEIPVYLGDAVNDLTATPQARRADPWRLLTSYDRSRDTLAHLRGSADRPVFVSHEALLKDYEEPLTRGGPRLYSAGGHLTWVGERTRNFRDWHVQWAASIVNPVGVKLGAAISRYEVIDLVHTLDPYRRPGRVSLISRLGADRTHRLGPVAQAVTASRAPVVWQCDPMHGNTRTLAGTKLRLLPDLREEITAFVRTLRAHGCHPGGLHLEVTPDPVLECHEAVATADGTACPPCDPRLNSDQALDIVDHFARLLITPSGGSI
ncbi:3-deoxy-7-phosphoheptulonate synthase [Streptomyces sp. NPDC006668]|uniref:3-deoxy-7-phosphoheptulonate synthase n=1 Tax=Streptomyces sp. NPDC006668 TaxID=3156903 RepID=UPI0033CF560C